MWVVVLQGLPLAGARVGLSSLGESFASWSDRTDANGVFAIAGATPGSYQLTVGYGEGGRLLSRRLAVTGDVDLDLVLGRIPLGPA